MRRSLTRFLAVPVAAAGILAGAAMAAPAALASTDTGGTVTVTVPLSFVNQLAKAGITGATDPLSEESTDTTNQTATVTFTVTGGNGDVSVFFGSVDLSGKLNVANACKSKAVSLGSLQLDLANGDIAGTPAGSTTPVPLLDLAGNQTFVPGTTSQSYTASDLTVDPAGAAYLDKALHTSAFTAGQDTGGNMAATWGFTQ